MVVWVYVFHFVSRHIVILGAWSFGRRDFFEFVCTRQNMLVRELVPGKQNLFND